MERFLKVSWICLKKPDRMGNDNCLVIILSIWYQLVIEFSIGKSNNGQNINDKILAVIGMLFVVTVYLL